MQCHRWQIAGGRNYFASVVWTVLRFHCHQWWLGVCVPAIRPLSMVRVRWMAGRVQQSCGRCQALNQLNPPARIFRGLRSFNFRGNLLREIALVRTLVVSISSTIFISSSLMFAFYMVFAVGNICVIKCSFCVKLFMSLRSMEVCCHKKFQLLFP